MLLVETPIFTRRLQKILTDDEYRFLQEHLVNKPDSGKEIRNSGGIRKLRWMSSSHGKRGGCRVIYYWFRSREVILFLFIYNKNEQDDLTSEQLYQLRKVIEGEY